VNLADPFPKSGSMLCGQAGSCDVVFSYPTFRDLERTQTVFSGLAAHLAFGVSLSYRDQSTTGEGMYVSGSYFPTLGLRPALGRLLGPADDQGTGTNYVAVLGYGYWQSQFGSDPGVLGRPLPLHAPRRADAGAHAVQRHRDRAPHRVRQYRESLAGARRRPRYGDGRPSGPRREPPPGHDPVAHRVGAPRLLGRARRSARDHLDAD